MESKNMYIEHRENMLIAERDIMQGDITQITPIDPLKLKPVKITVKNKNPDIVMTPKREKALFIRDYLRKFGKITVNGLARKYESILRDKPSPEVIREFIIVIDELIDMGKLKENSVCRENPIYTKIINPDNLEVLINDVQEK